MKLLLTIAILLISCISYTSLPVAHAQDTSETSTTGEGRNTPQDDPFYIPPDEGSIVVPNPGGSFNEGIITEDVFRNTIAVRVLNIISNIFIGLSVLFLVIAGFQYVLSQGDEEKIKKSHQSLMWAILGTMVIILSYTIIFIITTIFS